MPDGSVSLSVNEEIDLSSPNGINEMLKGLASEALQNAIDDCGGDPKTVNVDTLLARFAWHVHERMAQGATTVSIVIGTQRELGRRDVREAEAAQRAAVDRVVEAASRATGRPATDRHPKSEIDAFTAGVAEQLAKNLQAGLIAITGRMRRGELPQLEPRTEAVYLANACGRAIGNLLALHLHVIKVGDALLVRRMREAMADGFNDVFGSVAEAFTGRVN